MLFAVTQSVTSVLFMLMMPLFIVGHYVDQKLRRQARTQGTAEEVPGESMAAFRHGHHASCRTLNGLVRLQEAPSVSDTVDSIYKLGPLLWTHRPEHTGLPGAAVRPRHRTLQDSSSRNPIQLDTETEYRREIEECLAQFRDIEGVPVVSQLRTAGSFGLAGSRGLVDDVARGSGAAARGPAFPGGSSCCRHHLGAVPKERWELAAVAAARRLEPQPRQRRPPCCRLRRRLSPAVPARRPRWNSARGSPRSRRDLRTAAGRRPEAQTCGYSGAGAAVGAGNRRGRRAGGPRPADPASWSADPIPGCTSCGWRPRRIPSGRVP
jgi:hypothetical protein